MRRKVYLKWRNMWTWSWRFPRGQSEVKVMKLFCYNGFLLHRIRCLPLSKHH